MVGLNDMKTASAVQELQVLKLHATGGQKRKGPDGHSLVDHWEVCEICPPNLSWFCLHDAKTKSTRQRIVCMYFGLAKNCVAFLFTITLSPVRIVQQ